MSTTTTHRAPILPPPPTPHHPPIVRVGRGGLQGASLGLLGLGLGPGLGMLVELGIVSLPPGRTRPTMTTTKKMLISVFGGGG